MYLKISVGGIIARLRAWLDAFFQRMKHVEKPVA